MKILQMMGEALLVRKPCLCFSLCLFFCAPAAFAQQYTGMSGLIHVPSADMDKAGAARVGVHFLHKEFTPDVMAYKGQKYHTMTHYLSITPFSWIEIGYTCTLLRCPKVKQGVADETDVGLYRKDRYFSLKLRPLKEKDGKWWPAVAIGTNDPYSTTSKQVWSGWVQQTAASPRSPTGGEEQAAENGTADSNKTGGTTKDKGIGSRYFANFYVAATKHFDLKGNSLGVHLAYRQWKRDDNNRWEGPVGGLTFRPRFQKNLRLIAEYTGSEVNAGFDWKLWKHWLVQASLQDGKYFSGGLCFYIEL